VFAYVGRRRACGLRVARAALSPDCPLPRDRRYDRLPPDWGQASSDEKVAPQLDPPIAT